ncbi:hypothetical protein DH2020_032926 [Rehmannia glutinosa]|uniref:Prephenate dehydratase domain-containing protein n=1 Tax=Rehmannia glutinosa TaxID=99300 RepID=A0ABR0VFG8_REHGL
MEVGSGGPTIAQADTVVDGEKRRSRGVGHFGFVGCRPTFLNFRVQRELECPSHRAITPVEDEIPSAPGVVEETTRITLARGFHKDLNSLPKPLSATDFSASSSGGKKVRVAYQGFQEHTVRLPLKAYPKCETVPCDLFEAAFKAVELWLADKAVLPIENSVGGSIHRNYDLLLRHRLHIVGEVQLVVNHCLLGLPGVRKEELKRVLSHPQALDQCETTLNELGVTRVTADDTAHAAQETGAVASARAAEIYGLDVLAEGIQKMENEKDVMEDPSLYVKEIQLLQSHLWGCGEGDNGLSNAKGSGILFKALAVFALRGISLSKIESRPQKMRPLRVVDDSNTGSATYFDYLFFIDFEASMAEPRAQFALGHLQEFARFLESLVVIRLIQFYE